MAAAIALPHLALGAMPRPPVEVAAPPAIEDVAAGAPAQLTLKRRVAIGRFSNSTRYGKALLFDGENDPVAQQAADMLTARLVDSGKFIVFERSDLDVLQREQATAGGGGKLVGVDALVLGSVTEFGRTVEGKSGFLNSSMKQTVKATVEVRLVDVQTGQAFFSTSGSGSASVEAGEVAGFGSQSGYDSSLNDRAISAAVSDLTNKVMQKLEERRWFTDVLQVRGGEVLISGGPGQGMKVGDRFRIETRGERVTSGQTGLPITLPGRSLASIQVVSFFGDGSSGEGAVARVVDGQLPPVDAKTMIVVEDGQ